MDPDNFQQAWQAQSSQSRLTVNAELLLKEVVRNRKTFAAIILRRDMMEIGVGVLLIPIWFYMGAKLSLPWTWYLEVPALVFTVGFMLVDRWRHTRQPPERGEPLRQCVASSLAQVEHQIWLLRNIFWWYILPSALAMSAFFVHVAWMTRSGGWRTAAIMAQVVAISGGILVFVYWLNQYAVRTELEPRRRELESLLASFQDETPASQ
jgi:hypothetical protein